MLIELDSALFRKRFPEFADEACYPEASLEVAWFMAGQYVSQQATPCGALGNDARGLACQLLTAHILALRARAGAGGAPGIVTASTIDKVSVTLAAPPYGSSGWKYWLNLTPYGAELLALLSVKASGGWYVGGLPEGRAFRKVGGVF